MGEVGSDRNISKSKGKLFAVVWACEEKGRKLWGRRVMEMEIPGKKRRGRPKRRWMDNITEDMEEFLLKERDAEIRRSGEKESTMVTLLK